MQVDLPFIFLRFYTQVLYLIFCKSLPTPTPPVSLHLLLKFLTSSSLLVHICTYE